MRYVRWAISWALFHAGDLVSRWNDDDRRFTETGWAIYQTLMLRSSEVQGDTDFGPWSRIIDPEWG